MEASLVAVFACGLYLRGFDHAARHRQRQGAENHANARFSAKRNAPFYENIMPCFRLP
jgi:hypothetical protein